MTSQINDLKTKDDGKYAKHTLAGLAVLSVIFTVAVGILIKLLGG